MSLLQFLKENPADEGGKEYRVKLDGRLKDADPFVIKTLDKVQYKNLQNMSMKNNKIDTSKLASNVVLEACTEPKFNDMSLVKEYKVGTPIALIEKLLTPGEISALAMQIIEASGLNISSEILEDEVKN